MTCHRLPAEVPPGGGAAKSASDAAATRALILILAVAGFASTFAGRITEPLVGVIARDLATDPKTVALLSTAYALPYAFIQPILGPIGDGVGKARVMQVCLAVLAVSLVASALATSSDALFALRVISGAAAGGVIPLALATIGDRVGMAGRQVAISRFLIATILGQVIGSSLAGVLSTYLGWRGVFIAAGAIAAASCAAAVLRLRPRPAAARGGFSLSTALANYRALFGNPRARALFGLVFVEALAIFGTFPYIAPLLEARGEGGALEAGITLAAFGAGGLVYTALVGLMLARLGLSRMLVAGGLLAAAALAVFSLGSDWRAEAVAMVALGLGFYMLHNSFQTQVTEVAPQARASAVALHAFSFFCGQALGVVLVGFGLGALGQAATFLACAGVITGVGLTAAWALGRFAAQPRAR